MRSSVLLSRISGIIIAISVSLIDYLKLLFRRASCAEYFRWSRQYPPYLLTGNAMSFCMYHAEQYCFGTGLDIGCGDWVFKNARGIDNTDNENALKINEKDKSQDFVFSSHCLEHISDYGEALDEWTRVLKIGGILYLYLPHPACRMWRPETLKSHKQIIDPNSIEKELIDRKYRIVEISRFPDIYFSFHVVAENLPKDKQENT